MGYTRLLLLLAIFANVSTPLLLNFVAIFTVPQALAQNPDRRKVEADRIFKQGEQQLNSGQVKAALESFQQTLLIYQQIKERLAEGHTHRNIGNAYYLLKNYSQAIAHQQQALIIAREIKNPDLEARALLNLGLA